MLVIVLRDWKFWVLLALALILVALTIVNIGLADENYDRRLVIAERQQFITESTRLSEFNTQFVQALANLAAQTDDQSIRQLLADHGVTYTVKAPEATGESDP